MTFIENTRRTAMVLVFAALVLSLPGMADTFFLNGDVPVNGKLVRSDETYYHISIGGRTKRIPKKSIKRIEENDKDGAFDLNAAKEKAAKRQQEITEQTGLSREERDAIEQLIVKLKDTDAAVVGKARRDLTEMCKEEKVYAYIANMVPTLAPVHIRELLIVLASADAVKAQPLVLEFTTYVDEAVRAECLELLGIMRDASSLSLMMRGMLDHEPVVRLAACTALTAIGAKEATPLLLNNFNNADLRVQNYAREALALIWKAELGETEPFKTQSEWQTFWDAQSPSVVKTVNIEGLEPLVPPGTYYRQC